MKEISIAPELTFRDSNGGGTNVLPPLAGVHYILPKEPSSHSHKENYSGPAVINHRVEVGGSPFRK
jgi:hypothetical protein